MNRESQFRKFVERRPHAHKPFFERPYLTRRSFFRLAGGAVTGTLLAGRPAVAEPYESVPVTTIDKAKNVIFILLAGAPSHTDLFDYKEVPNVTPSSLAPETINGILWPTGLMPNLAGNLPDLAIVRSVRAWALVHNLAQTWSQIGRNPAAALGDIAPNIGSIVAIEKEAERLPSQVFPTFIALNANGAAGSGYLSSAYAPFKLRATAASGASGLPNSTPPAGFDARWNLVTSLDGGLRTNSPLGSPVSDYHEFYLDAKALMDKAQPGGVVDQAFKYTRAEVEPYGDTSFGAACLVARKVLQVNQGTRFIQIILGGWDHHTNIYADANLPAMSRTLDGGLSALLNDLKRTGLLSTTLVVVMGEFGRTVGALSASQGRDHFMQQSVLFAGAGVRGGRALGATNASGSATEDSGWSRQRDIRPEDIEATLYSAMGINWTTVRYDDPLGRGFEYVPFSHDDIYGPINELWS